MMAGASSPLLDLLSETMDQNDFLRRELSLPSVVSKHAIPASRVALHLAWLSCARDVSERLLCDNRMIISRIRT